MAAPAEFCATATGGASQATTLRSDQMRIFCEFDIELRLSPDVLPTISYWSETARVEFDAAAKLSENWNEWACGAAGSALPWHGRGRRFDPDQVHQISRATPSARAGG